MILPGDSDAAMAGAGDVEYERMEQWLDAHPDFVQDFFSRKATRSMIDSWMMVHSESCGSPVLLGYDAASSTGSNSRTSSGANTPVRKISAQEFEKRGQILKPMVLTVDGVPSFLSPSAPAPAPEPQKMRRRRSELKALDERELMYELVMDICNELEMTSLCYKILQNVGLLLGADRCSLFLIQGEGDLRCLVSKLFDVSMRSTLQDCRRESAEIRVPWGTGIVGYVALTGEPVNIPEAYQDSRFNKEVDLKTGYRTRSILCMPIKNFNGDVIGVAQAINKSSIKDEPFNEHDEKVFKLYLAFCGIGIHNAVMYERSTLENRRNQLMLDLAWVIFEEQSNVANLIRKIMLHTQSLLRCERCQVMLVDSSAKGTFSQVFGLQATDFVNDDSCRGDEKSETRFSINIGITGYVAVTGETLNIPDAYSDDRFDPAVDKESGFRTQSILCMPIKNALGQIIGVAQLTNKLDGTPFNKNDENLFEAFAIFSGMGINNTHMYEQAVKAMARQRIAIEVMSYHSSASDDEVLRLKKCAIPSSQHYSLTDYHFSDFLLDDDDTLKATVRMFLDLNLVDKFHITNEVFLRWVLTVKKNYRAVAYHNWRHAFNVTQTMFAMILKGNLRNILNDLESLALLVGCLSHDLDHRGTNNQFQIKTMSPLAELYSTSTMERHHFDHCVLLLNTKGNEIFANLSEDDHKRVMVILEEAILATDLALYFKHRGEFIKLVNSENADWHVDEHRNLLRNMMMTACDVSAITKPWHIQKKVAGLIASEFFDQGDMEKQQLQIKPIDMMDRDKKSLLPTMQIGFIDSICLPIYQAFSKLDNQFEPLYAGCQSNRERWLELAENRYKHDDETENQDNEKHNDYNDEQAESV